MDMENSSKDDSFEEFDLDVVLNESNKINFVVSKSQFETILKEVGTSIDNNDLLVDSETDEPEKSNSEDVIMFDKLGVLSAGSKIFIEKNIASFSEFLIARCE